MSIDPERLADLRARKLAALVRSKWGEPPASARSTSFPGGAALVDADSARVWVLTEDDDSGGRLGGALALAVRADAHEVHLLVSDAGAGAVLARRASQFTIRPLVWLIEGAGLRAVEPAPTAIEPALPPEAELYRPVLVAAGLEAVAEGGELIGEYRGLEVARVVVADDGSAHVEAGIGRFDREAGAMMFAEQGETDALARVVALVAGMRTSVAERHPINQLVLERWLRAAVVAHPELVGAERLAAAPSAVPRKNLLETGVASAVGIGLDGQPIVVTCCTGVHLDLVASAADDRLSLEPDARLVLALPATDALPIMSDLAARLAAPAEVIGIAHGWRDLAPAVG